MFIIRPVKREDIDSIVELASQAKAGLTTLPHDKNLLIKRIEQSIAGFSKKIEKPEGELYFFVLEEIASHKILGTSAIVSKVGGFEPFYTYEMKSVVKESKVLNVRNEIQYLQLVKKYNGPSEVGTLFLHPDARQSGNGRLLSLSRFLFMAQYWQRFESEVIAELRGVVDDNDCSPFWEAVCRHFFEVDFKKADLMVMEDKSFIEDLIPQYPIYIPLLPEAVQDVIGEVHKNTRPALALLIQEGFYFYDEVDIFEAGPVVGAKLNEIRTIKESREVVVESIEEDLEEKEFSFIANVDLLENFCVMTGPVIFNEDGSVKIRGDAASGLGVAVGSKVRIVSSGGRC